jgi:hypothetical protein
MSENRDMNLSQLEFMEEENNKLRESVVVLVLRQQEHERMVREFDKLAHEMRLFFIKMKSIHNNGQTNENES